MSRMVLVAGAGAAGLAAAYGAAFAGADVLVLEKNEKPGKKLLITGSGRCNLTHEGPLESFISAYFGQGRFLYPAFRRFFRPELIELLGKYGVQTKTDLTGRIFPQSNRSEDVLQAWLSACRAMNVSFHYGESVQSLITEPFDRPYRRKIRGVLTSRKTHQADAVILACGGATYPKTGSTGDGYRLAQAAGHTITPIRPSLVGLCSSDPWVTRLSGICCPDVKANLFQQGQCLAESRGNLLFTHFGVSGPVAFSLSRAFPVKCETEKNRKADACQFIINFIPDVKQQDLLDSLKICCQNHARALLYNVIAALALDKSSQTLPKSVAAFLVHRSIGQEPQNIKAGQIKPAQLEQLAYLMQHLPLSVTGTRGYDEAMVTAGGIALDEIDPRTMMSKRVHGLFAAGEVLDIDGDTGGFNLQAAFSTGYLAGESAANLILHPYLSMD